MRTRKKNPPMSTTSASLKTVGDIFQAPVSKFTYPPKIFPTPAAARLRIVRNTTGKKRFIHTSCAALSPIRIPKFVREEISENQPLLPWFVAAASRVCTSGQL
jgi:hypothetical protein